MKKIRLRRLEPATSLQVSWRGLDGASPTSSSFQGSEPTWYAAPFHFSDNKRKNDVILVMFLDLKLNQFIQLP